MMNEEEIKEKVREYRKFRENIFSQFLDIEEKFYSPLQLSAYNLCDAIWKGNKGKWKNVPFMNSMIGGELREIINRLNSWCSYLDGWSVWLQVLSKHNEDEAWDIRCEFVDTLVYFCMFQPSAMRDALCFIATNAIHQTNLNLLPEYKDKLDSDNINKSKNNITLSRKQAEAQLVRLGCEYYNWKNFKQFYQKLTLISTEKYQKVTTRDFRNLSSHKIAPRFELGVINFVHRYVTFRTKFISKPDKKYLEQVKTDEKVVAYGFGGMLPLSLQEMYDANEKEYKLSVEALKAYENLLEELINALEI